MPNCPKCQQPVDATALKCPYCRTVLKAHGHPGINLYRATGDTFLCDNCTYHEDDTCTFPQRPYAQECTLYQNKFQQNSTFNQNYLSGFSWVQQVRFWCQRHRGLLMLLGLAVVSVVVTVLSYLK